MKKITKRIAATTTKGQKKNNTDTLSVRRKKPPAKIAAMDTIATVTRSNKKSPLPKKPKIPRKRKKPGVIQIVAKVPLPNEVPMIVQEEPAPFTPADTEVDKKGNVSSILGFVGLVAWLIPFVGIPITLTGVIFGIRGLNTTSHKQAITGITLCSIGLILSLINTGIGVYLGLR